MERYTYHIHPHKTITNVIKGKGIRKPMALKLTKEEVMKCIACGPVYRAFPEGAPVRVTGSNLNDVHVSWEDWIKKLESKKSNIVEVKKEEMIPEEPKAEEVVVEPEAVLPLEPGPVIIEEEKEEELIPIPVEPGPVIIEEETITEEEVVPVPIEPGPVIIEEEESVVEEDLEEETEDVESEDDDEEVEETEEEPLVNSNGQLVPQQIHHKKKKKRH